MHRNCIFIAFSTQFCPENGQFQCSLFHIERVHCHYPSTIHSCKVSDSCALRIILACPCWFRTNTAVILKNFSKVGCHCVAEPWGTPVLLEPIRQSLCLQQSSFSGFRQTKQGTRSQVSSLPRDCRGRAKHRAAPSVDHPRLPGIKEYEIRRRNIEAAATEYK